MRLRDLIQLRKVFIYSEIDSWSSPAFEEKLDRRFIKRIFNVSQMMFINILVDKLSSQSNV